MELLIWQFNDNLTKNKVHKRDQKEVENIVHTAYHETIQQDAM